MSSLVHKATPEEVACQHPKGILLSTGAISIPYPWAPDSVPIQILRVGQLVMLCIPTEMTTMAGRRLREAIKATMVAQGLLTEASGVVVIAGLSNAYADYTTTFEEYQQQRYEGAARPDHHRSPPSYRCCSTGWYHHPSPCNH